MVYDLNELGAGPVEILNDLPAGEWRRVQRAHGYRWIMVNGKVVFEDGKCTIRSARACRPGAGGARNARHGAGQRCVSDQRQALAAEVVDHAQHTEPATVGQRVGGEIQLQMAEVAVPRALFQQVLSAIVALRPSSPPARC
jgi:hypothetical protein